MCSCVFSCGYMGTHSWACACEGQLMCSVCSREHGYTLLGLCMWRSADVLFCVFMWTHVHTPGPVHAKVSRCALLCVRVSTGTLSWACACEGQGSTCGVISQELCILFFWDGALTKPEACQFRADRQPVSPRDPPASLSLVLGLLCAPPHQSAYVGAEHHTHVHRFVQWALHCLSHLSSPAPRHKTQEMWAVIATHSGKELKKHVIQLTLSIKFILSCHFFPMLYFFFRIHFIGVCVCGNLRHICWKCS